MFLLSYSIVISRCCKNKAKIRLIQKIIYNFRIIIQKVICIFWITAEEAYEIRGYRKKTFLEKLPKRTMNYPHPNERKPDLRGNTTDDRAGIRLFQIEERRFLKHEIH